MKYREPEMEIVLFEEDDIVTGSPGILDDDTQIGGGTEDDDSLGFEGI